MSQSSNAKTADSEEHEGDHEDDPLMPTEIEDSGKVELPILIGLGSRHEQPAQREHDTDAGSGDTESSLGRGRLVRKPRGSGHGLMPSDTQA